MNFRTFLRIYHHWWHFW